MTDISQFKKNIDGYPYIQYTPPDSPPQISITQWYEWMRTRRSVRHFASKPVPKEIMFNILANAATAPSGANKQPWTFCLIGNDALKTKIKIAAEKEEKEFYASRAGETWLQDLLPLGTDPSKPFLEIAPWLIVVFRKSYELLPNGIKQKNYYSTESVGIACGFLLNAIHAAGLVALTQTPAPMSFLQEILGRPENEKPFLLIPVGYPAEECWIPDIHRKPLNEVILEFD